MTAVSIVVTLFIVTSFVVGCVVYSNRPQPLNREIEEEWNSIP